jgi:type IV pilus assembly protein PilB
VNIGIEPYLISAALNAVLAQRLVRRVCPKCRTPYELPRPLRKTIERMGYGMDVFYKGAGCKRCRNTGYSGRIGVHELLLVDDRLRDAIVAGASVIDLRRIGIENGMVTLRKDGFRKVREGLTTVEEVIHITGDSALAERAEKCGTIAEEVVTV